MNEAKPRSERSDAAENRQRILDTALSLFEQHGVEQVSMNQISIEAQIGAGTLYRRYRNKSELCLDLIKDNLVLLFEDMETYLEQHRTDQPSQRLRGVLKLFIDFREKKVQLLAGVEDGTLTNGAQSITNSPVYAELHAILLELFREMTSTRQNDSNNVFKADMLLIALKNDSYVFQRDVRGYSPDSFLDQLCLTFFPEGV